MCTSVIRGVQLRGPAHEIQQEKYKGWLSGHFNVRYYLEDHYNLTTCTTCDPGAKSQVGLDASKMSTSWMPSLPPQQREISLPILI
ncbi:hypothetical protein D9758_006204 [Tetrapyrgos nigripes]|uniref:Uncharacterized protein n=1 Tax=Tetrapyrgos nigripes TaxID=182062 RepID=A0A8H5GAP0_9AGAR|nr:hypothetical protein D9758_006204 [Tetrapyrgos nigripes]